MNCFDIDSIISGGLSSSLSVENEALKAQESREAALIEQKVQEAKVAEGTEVVLGKQATALKKKKKPSSVSSGMGLSTGSTGLQV